MWLGGGGQQVLFYAFSTRMVLAMGTSDAPAQGIGVV
jgi:hypothetical protein